MGQENFESKTARIADPTDAASALASGFMDSFRAPATGARQLFGDERAASKFFQAQEPDHLGAGVFRTTGSLLGTAALYACVNTALRTVPVPGIGKFAPVITGAAIGFFRPLHEEAGTGTRLMNAGVGAGSMMLIDKGQDFYVRMGLGGKIFASESSLMLQAGALNTQAESLIEHGRPAGFRDTVIGATSWLAMGKGVKALALESNVGRYWVAKAHVDRSSLGPAHAAAVRKLEIPVGSRVIPSFETPSMTVPPTPKPWVLDAGHPVAQLFEAHSPAVVRLRSNRGGSGSGFFVDEAGYIGTAAHVVQKNGVPLRMKADLPDGRSLRAHLVAIDTRTDTALLKVDGAGFRRLEMSPTKPPVDTPVYVFGHPEGARPMFVTAGAVVKPDVLPPGAHPKAVGSLEYTLGTSANSWPGNSGGPILGADGKVVAVLTHGTPSSLGGGTNVEYLRKLLLSVQKPGA